MSKIYLQVQSDRSQSRGVQGNETARVKFHWNWSGGKHSEGTVVAQIDNFSDRVEFELKDDTSGKVLWRATSWEAYPYWDVEKL